MDKLLLNLNEAKELLGVGRNRMFELVHSQGFPSIKLGNKWYVHKDKLKLWLNEKVGAI